MVELGFGYQAALCSVLMLSLELGWRRDVVGPVLVQGGLACSSVLLTPNFRRIPAIIVCLRASGSQSC